MLAAHLQVVEVADDDVLVQFLDDALLGWGHPCSHVLLLLQLCHVQIVVLRLVLICLSFLIPNIGRIATFDYSLRRLLKSFSICKSSVTSDFALAKICHRVGSTDSPVATLASSLALDDHLLYRIAPWHGIARTLAAYTLVRSCS